MEQINLKKQILTYLYDFIEKPSVSDSDAEHLGADWLQETLKNQPYFQIHPEDCGSYEIPGDYRKRHIVYGLVKGGTDRTVILTGHYDVVGIEEYGALKPLAFQVEKLTEAIKTAPLDEESRKDLESGEWLFGRGTADMKGGLCAGLAVLGQIGEEVLAGTFQGKVNVLFMAVPDEESYSAGMRGAAGLLQELQKSRGLTYECLLCLEPNTRDIAGEKQSVYIGSVGKCMPVALVQGLKAHVGTCFQGINAVSVLSRFLLKTEVSPQFADVYKGEMCVPPTWLYLKDQKELYDVSLPYRACGYINMLQFDTTPEQVMTQLKALAQEAFVDVIGTMQASCREIAKKAGQQPDLSQIPSVNRCKVLEFSQLQALCREKDAAGFAAYYEKQYEEICRKIQGGEWNYPQATVEMMKRVLDFADMTEPVMVLGFAPPFYPAFHSDRLPGKTGAGSAYFAKLQSVAMQVGTRLQRYHYFTGISDLSYCGSCTEYDHTKYYDNTPLWGDLYQVDFAGINELNIPSILFGPWGKNLHQRTERVHIKSLTEETPAILLAFINTL